MSGISGINAGYQGYDGNTDLKGAVIDSAEEKGNNKLTTGTLTWEDIDNKAEYKSKDSGISIDTGTGADKNKAGVTPSIGMPAEGKAESTTKAGVAAGKIEITEEKQQKQDVNKLNRDTKNSLNKLETIFDKQTVEERKEMAKLFGELAYNAVHKISAEHGFKEGSAEKNALHALIGGIMSQLTSGNFLAGASGAMINEMIQQKLAESFKDDPAMHQWASALVGTVVSQIVSGKGQAGASAAVSGTKNNYLFENQLEAKAKELKEARDKGATEEEIAEINKKWDLIDQMQDEALEAYGYSGELADGKDKPSLEMQEKISKYATWLAENKEIVNVLTTSGTIMLSKGIVISAVDESAKDEIIKGLEQNTKISASQIYPEVNFKVNITPKSTVIIKNMVKAGVMNVGATGYDIYVDVEKYQNLTDVSKAVTVDIVALGATVAAGTAIAAVNSSVFAIVGYGAIIGFGISSGAEIAKENWIGR